MNAGAALLLSTLLAGQASAPAEFAAEASMTPAATSALVRVSLDRLPADPGAQPETQVEPQVAISPLNPKVVFAVWQDGRMAGFGAAAIGWAVSRDEGKTWTRGRIPRLTTADGGPFPVATDPWIAFDAAGRAYVAALVRRASGASGIVVASTANLGGAWRGPVLVHETSNLDDKVSLAVDTVAGSPFRGTVYVGWSFAGRPVVARSRDQGRTFGPPIELPGDGNCLGLVMAATTGGRLHAVWQQGGGAVEGTAQRSSFSTDGGATWAPARTIGAVVSAGVLGVRTGDGLPSFAAAGPRLFVVWQDGRFAPDETVHVALSTSTDRGLTWSAPRRISGGPLRPASFLPAVAVDAAGGVGVAFYSVRNDPARAFLADLFIVTSANGGRTFSAPRRLTPRSFDLRAAAIAANQAFVGDYFGLAASGRKYHALFVGTPLRSAIDAQHFQPDVLAVSFDR